MDSMKLLFNNTSQTVILLSGRLVLTPMGTPKDHKEVSDVDAEDAAVKRFIDQKKLRILSPSAAAEKASKEETKKVVETPHVSAPAPEPIAAPAPAPMEPATPVEEPATVENVSSPDESSSSEDGEATANTDEPARRKRRRK